VIHEHAGDFAMATAAKGPTGLEKIGWYLEHCNHAAWDRFNVDEQRAMIDEDLTAACRWCWSR
jgi:hypothetical protein